MEDDQWNYPPKRGSNERPQPGGGNSGPLPNQRPGAPRPSGAIGPNAQGRPMGSPNTASFGQPPMSNSRDSRALPRAPSSPLSQSQGPWRDDSWNQSQQRRGPSGPLNPGAPAARRSGGLGGQDQRGRTNSGWETGTSWQGQGNTRTSRNLTPPTGRPALGGRGQTGQRNNDPRGWEDEEEAWNSRQPRTSGGMAASGGRGQPQGRKGTAMRGDWVVELEPKYKAPTSSLRVRLLLLLLVIAIAAGAGVFFVPGAKGRLLAFLPGSKNTPGAPVGATSGKLTLQVNAPNAKVTLDTKTYTTTAGQTAPFSSVSIPALAQGNHTITIHADNFTDFSGQLQMPAGDAAMTAWLAPTADQLTALAGQFKPATQPDPGVAGDHYNATGVAAGKITVSISYTLSGLSASTFAGQLVQGSDTKTAPFKPAALALVPVITFKNAAGTQLYQYKPQALPTSQFALQMPLAFDAKGAPQFGTPTITLPSNVTADFAGPTKNDYTLYYALAAILPTTTNALKFSCIGAVDNKNFNPEDGLFLTEAGGAHYFYRWGMLWGTNAAAQTLTPKALHAVPGSKEFNDANTAHANNSCGN